MKTVARKASSGSKRKRGESPPTTSIKTPVSGLQLFMYDRIEEIQLSIPHLLFDDNIEKAITEEFAELSYERRQHYEKLADQMSKGCDKTKKPVTEEEVDVKKIIQSRLSLSKVVKLNQSLNAQQEEAVRSIGFGGLLHLKSSMLKHYLCIWLMDCFNPDTRTLEVHGHKVKITNHDVEMVFGLKNEGVLVPRNGCNKDIEELCTEYSVSDSIIPLQKLFQKLESCSSDGAEFKRMYCLYVIGYLLSPITDLGVHKNILHALKDTDSISSYNWAKYVLDSLADGIHRHKNKQQKYVSGCLYLLMILFFEHFRPHQSDLQRHEVSPCIGFWSNAEVSKIIKEYESNGGFGCKDAVVLVHDRFGVQETSFDNGQPSSELCTRMSVIEMKVDQVKKELSEVKDEVVKMKDEVVKNQLYVNDQVFQLSLVVKSVVEKLDSLEHRLRGEIDKNANEQEEDGNNGADEDGADNDSDSGDKDEADEDGADENGADNDNDGDGGDGVEENMVQDDGANPVDADDQDQPWHPLLMADFDGFQTSENLPPKYQFSFATQPHSSKGIENDDSASCTYPAKKDVDCGRPVKPVTSKSIVLVSNTEGSVGVAPQPQNMLASFDGWQYMSNDEKLADFLFSDERPVGESIVVTKLYDIQRKRMKGLLPGQFISGCIIDTLAWQLTLDARECGGEMKKWYMPSIFAQQILEGGLTQAEKLTKNYLTVDKFTGPLVQCDEIYIPMNYDESHWFLCIVDFATRSVKICDSMFNKRKAKKVEDKVESLLLILDKMMNMYDEPTYYGMGPIKSFMKLHPQWVPQQSNGWDCGLYVCMIMEGRDNIRCLTEYESRVERNLLALKLWRHFSNELNPLQLNVGC